MSGARLPDFEHTLAIAQGNLEAPELAECHGVACGLLSRHSNASLMNMNISILKHLFLSNGLVHKVESLFSHMSKILHFLNLSILLIICLQET